MKFTLIGFIFFYVNNTLIFSQTKDEPVANVGSQSISSEEFQYRYELTPQMFRERDAKGNELKQEFLYTLIAEKLFALYGESISLDTADIVRYTLKSFEEMFVRDELYKQMIVDKAKFKVDSLLGFYLSNSTQARLTYIRTNSFAETEKIYELLKKGVSFDFFSSDTSLSMGDTLTTAFGQLDEATENEILTLPVNAFSKPLHIDDQWYIFNVIEKQFPIIERSPGWEAEYKRLAKLAKERVENNFYKDYISNIFGNLKIRADGKLLKIFAEGVYEILEKKRLRNENQKKQFLEVSDLALINEKLSIETLNAAFITLPDGPIPLKDFINFFRFENISFDSISYQKVVDVLNGKAKKFIEYKVLANEGYKFGLDKTKDVQDKVNMWMQNYYYQLVMAEFADSSSVTDDEIKAYYNQSNRGKYRLKEVNIIEVLVQDLEIAQKVLNELENGIDIKELAIKYSISADATSTGSEPGFKPISYFGEIGTILDKMKIGQVYGPVKVTQGYSIFKLIDVQEDSSSDQASFNQVRMELGRDLRYLKMKDSINQFITKLANQYGITINKELLNSIQTTTHNSIVFEFLGFGGRITAVPLISTNSEWVESWLNSLKVMP